jgi:threonine/homoserine efflux transporter RhtA
MLNKQILIWFSVGLFIASLFCDAVAGMPGMQVLLMGWMEAFAQVSPFVAFAWFINPILIVMWIVARSKDKFLRNVGWLFAIFAPLFAAGYIVFGTTIVTNESGIASDRVGFTIGYGLWLTSIMLAAAAIFAPSNENADNQD